MDNIVKIKICGMTDIDNISKILFLEPDYLGFVFYPKSPRCVLGKLNPELLSIIPRKVKRTGVFMNSSTNEIRGYVETYGLQALQLHGNESPEMCNELRNTGLEIIKAFNLKSVHDFEYVWQYNDCADYFLFDTKSQAFGGSDTSFDWQLILRQPIRKPWFLAGGINPTNITEAAQSGAAGLDINSRFEIEPGIKDYDKLHEALVSINRLRE